MNILVNKYLTIGNGLVYEFLASYELQHIVIDEYYY